MTPVLLTGGVSVDWDMALLLLGIEDRGGCFVVTEGTIRVQPSDIMRSLERATLVAHKPEVLRILTYDADSY